MSKYSPLNLIKQNAKCLKIAEGITLSAAQESIAKAFRFNNFHELKKVAGQPITDLRILEAAFGVHELEQAIWEDDLPSELQDHLDEIMSSETADTNAGNFSFRGLDIEEQNYDESNGKLTLTGSLVYSGEQDQDRPYHGSEFYLDVEINLCRRENKWVFDEEDGVKILNLETDRDRDHAQEQTDLYNDYLASL
ncbi:hypothetical protein [Pseudomonas sp. S9]|uniref:hypothetical protein n=1 Tax=Pseudomonas sp. S9 TaxID=686578 RepID=UPI0002557644|nr:hypothetical protein [Pseudomonas sp. S9]